MKSREILSKAGRVLWLLAPVAMAFPFRCLAAIAQEATNSVPQASSYGYNDPLGGVSIPALVARIISRVLPLVGALFLVMFIWGGAMWMLAGGDETKIKKARQILLNSAIGMAIVIGAYAIVYNVLTILSP